MRIPDHKELAEFEAAHFTMRERILFSKGTAKLPRATGLSLDDSTLCQYDYAPPDE